MTELERAAKQERKLIKSEEKTESRLLEVRRKHDKAVRKSDISAARLHEAEEQLRAAQIARAAGPIGIEKPADA